MKLASVVGISGGIVGEDWLAVAIQFFPHRGRAPSFFEIKVPKIVEFLGGSLENQIANNKKQVRNLWAFEIFKPEHIMTFAKQALLSVL